MRKYYKENHIVIITTFFNVENYIIECLDSISRQKYNNWTCVLIDNNSNDTTEKLIIDYINNSVFKDKFIYEKFNKRESPVYCDIYAFDKYLKKDDICAVLCGDDKLLGDYALRIINNIYLDNPNVLLTYGSYYHSHDRTLGPEMPFDDFRFKNLRRLGSINIPWDDNMGYYGFLFNGGHFKTFRGELFQELKKQDPTFSCFKYDDSDEYIKHSADVIYMTPLMEIAGMYNVYFNETPIYLWRIHENNEHNNNSEKLKEEIITNNKPKFNEYNEKYVVLYAQHGLGDHLKLTTLPEEYYKLGYNVYLHDATYISSRNIEIIDLLWHKNPYIRGIRHETNMDLIIGNRIPNYIGKEFIESIEEINGVYNTKNVVPKIYYTPNNINYLNNKTVVNLQCISAIYDEEYVKNRFYKIIESLNINTSDILYLAIDTDKVNSVEYFKNINNVKNYNFLNSETYLCSSLEHHVDIINSCKYYITLMSGGAALAATIDKNRERTFVIVNHDEHSDGSILKRWMYPNQNYIW